MVSRRGHVINQHIHLPLEFARILETPSFRVNFKVLKRCEEMLNFGQHLKDLSNFSLRKQGYQSFFQEAVNHQQISFQIL